MIIVNKKSSTPGLDSFKATVIKHVAPVISRPLAALINHSLSIGFLSVLKEAVVCLIFISKCKYEFRNYRPISVLTVLSKIFERVMHTRIIKYLYDYSLLYDNQYGFRPKHSVNDDLALTTLLCTVQDAMLDKQPLVTVMMDHSKAFDTIDHAILLRKTFSIWYYWACTFLAQILLICSQITKVNDIRSISEAIS